MFPLKNTEAYIHANGFRSTLGKELSDRDAAISELGSEIQALTNKLEDEAETRAALGAHNLLNYNLAYLKDKNSNGTWASNVCTKNNTHFTVNPDLSITLNTESGGATNTTEFVIQSTAYFKKGNYILTGCPTGGGFTTFRLRVAQGFDESGTDLGDGVMLSLENDAVLPIYCKIDVTNGAVITTPVTFYPMIRLATDADATYQPYAKTNVELTQDVAVNTGTFTADYGTVNTDRTHVDVFGKMAVLSMHVNDVEVSIDSNTWTKIGSVSIAPKSVTMGALLVRNTDNTTSKMVVARIATNGNVEIDNDFSTFNVKGLVQGQIVYMT